MKGCPILRREVILPATAAAPLLARTAINDAIPPPELDERGDDARLAVSEIATNAVRHANLDRDGDVVRMLIEADDDHVRVEMEQSTSAGDVRVVSPSPDPSEQIGGFGLRLVEQAADSWGYDDGPPGRVWFEFRRREPSE